MAVDVTFGSKRGFSETDLQWNIDYARLATSVLISVHKPKAEQAAA